MTVSNGQLANQNTFNTYLMSRTSDTDAKGRLDLINILASSGASVLNIQKVINSIASMLGMTTAEVYNYIYTWPDNTVGLSSDTVLERILALIARFDGSTGHAHTGIDGDGSNVSASNLTDINPLSAQWQRIQIISVSGTSFNVSGYLAGKVPGGGSAALGVITTPPSNRCYLKDTSTETYIEDVDGQRIYGRITEIGGAWTLSFFTNESGVIDPAAISGPLDLDVYFMEVFNLATRPTIPSSPADFGTLDVTADVADASNTIRGVMNPAILQTLGGNKTWTGDQSFQNNFAFDLDNNTTLTGLLQRIPNNNKTVIRISNASLASIKGISAGVNGQIFILVNKTGVDIQISHDGDTVNGFYLPGDTNFTWRNSVGLLVEYNTIDNRWYLIGGGGGGGSLSNTVTDDLSASSGGVIAIDPSVGLQTFRVQAGASYVALSVTPFGSLPPSDGALIYLVGNNDDNTIEILENDIVNGCLMDGSVILTKGKCVGFMYLASLQRYVRIGL